jgi:hypothetical protein
MEAWKLARIFHTDRNEEAAKADGVRQMSILMPGCMRTYCPNQNVSLTQHPSGFPDSVVDEYEISGLDGDSIDLTVFLRQCVHTPMSLDFSIRLVPSAFAVSSQR